ncbi:Uncharacterised protein [Bordetella pertussis]|nr:Uncharacterised protein [Bordetella pertussis]
MVGMPGSASLGSRLVTASVLTLPSRACGMAMAGTMKPACTSPPMMAVITCGKPGYGICVRSMPASCLNISMARWAELPGPTEP